MSEKVITKVTPPNKHQSIKSTIYSLGERHRTDRETVNINTLRPNSDTAVWWQHALLVKGANTGEYYYGRPGTFSRSDARYGMGVLLCVFETIANEGITARLVAPIVPEIVIGKTWDPIGEAVDEVIVQNDFYLQLSNKTLNADISELPIEKMMNTVDELMIGSVGKNPWQLSTDILKVIIAVSDLQRGRIK